MLRLNGITHKYRTADVETRALRNVSLNVEPKEFVAIMGPSGCGKSTLLGVLGLLDSPAEGDYWFYDENVAKASDNRLAAIRRETIGYVFQSFNLINDLTVLENVELALKYGSTPRNERRKRSLQMLERFGLGARIDHSPQQLSGGQQQRVAICRALVSEPKLLLADEPTGNLDSENGEAVIEIIKEINAQGTTVVMVTHSEAQAIKADRIVRMMDGKVLSP